MTRRLELSPPFPSPACGALALILAFLGACSHERPQLAGPNERNAADSEGRRIKRSKTGCYISFETPTVDSSGSYLMDGGTVRKESVNCPASMLTPEWERCLDGLIVGSKRDRDYCICARPFPSDNPRITCPP